MQWLNVFTYLLTAMVTNLCPAAFTMENLDGGEWFVPGTVLGGNVPNDPFWKEVKAQKKTCSIETNKFDWGRMHPWKNR